MGLDYTDGCVNFRDVGDYINLISGKKIVQENRLLRGGSIDYVKTPDEIGHAKTIINLRNGADDAVFEVDYYHFPMANKVEKYDTSQKEVKNWLNKIIKTFENPAVQFPILVHCLSGKDRTGIVIAAILLILEIPQETIIEEYLLSEGEVKKEWIRLAIDGMQDIHTYFDRIDLPIVQKQLKKNLLNNVSST
ncbi:tyrosine phosphatase family protein [Kordia sp. SMS9]|uniref:tyrosine-protein phosphatase n=1 Tax=Kordia sp. SMS9 TaxID=2282170 RepID=UPI000E0DD5EC|nr:tyrosine-protein phosphatase [Kordia sp. SMS9]AXG68498.1 tyrosine phosphatase family protein [Kordia sp. SMS9]